MSSPTPFKQPLVAHTSLRVPQPVRGIFCMLGSARATMHSGSRGAPGCRPSLPAPPRTYSCLAGGDPSGTCLSDRIRHCLAGASRSRYALSLVERLSRGLPSSGAQSKHDCSDPSSQNFTQVYGLRQKAASPPFVTNSHSPEPNLLPCITIGSAGSSRLDDVVRLEDDFGRMGSSLSQPAEVRPAHDA